MPAGPLKDGIPAIDHPQFTTVSEAAGYVEPREPVVELRVDGEVRVYPIQVLIWHEITNDVIQGVPVAVTFCPLCNTALAFDRRVGDRVLDFGVTGVLRNSDLVMFDRQTESWWQQFGGEGLVGEFAGTELRRIPAAIVAFETIAAEHPDALVLSQETGFDRPYGQNPYPFYDSVDLPPFFRVEGSDDRIAPRQRVVFVEAGQEAVAIPFPDLEQAGTIEIELDGRSLEVVWLPGVTSTLDDTEIFNPFLPGSERDEALVTGSADVVAVTTGERVPFDTPFWFAVGAFRPDIDIVRG